VTAFLDLADPTFSATGPEVLAAREQDWWAETNYGVAVLRYAEVRELLGDRRLVQGSAKWPHHHGVETGPFVDWWSKTVLNLEGQDHHRLRRLLTPAFAPRHVTPLVPRFHELTHELIDAYAAEGRCEFVTQFARPYASRVATMVLGLPDSAAPQCAAWATDMGLALGVDIARHLPKVEAALEGLYGYADELIEQRRAEPADDAVTRLLDTLEGDELRGSIVLLIQGAIDTTQNQIGLAMAVFLDHTDQWALLAERPDLGRQAIDEVMRVAPTTTWTTREAAEDLEFKGLKIAKGTTVHLMSASASTDPSVYDPDRFDITVERERGVGFGGGIHHCLGHFVARTDMSEALPLLAQRMPNPRLDGEAEWLPLTGNTGPVTLPIAFG
jgi:cytochrome P450